MQAQYRTLRNIKIYFFIGRSIVSTFKSRNLSNRNESVRLSKTGAIEEKPSNITTLIIFSVNNYNETCRFAGDLLKLNHHDYMFYFVRNMKIYIVPYLVLVKCFYLLDFITTNQFVLWTEEFIYCLDFSTHFLELHKSSWLRFVCPVDAIDYDLLS